MQGSHLVSDSEVNVGLSLSGHNTPVPSMADWVIALYNMQGSHLVVVMRNQYQDTKLQTTPVPSIANYTNQC
jgi:hypothetical protein